MEKDDELFKSRISPEKAMKMLGDKGIKVNLEQAAKILYFLRKIANIAVSNHLNKRK
jgi:hypothetical protein